MRLKLTLITVLFTLGLLLTISVSFTSAITQPVRASMITAFFSGSESHLNHQIQQIADRYIAQRPQAGLAIGVVHKGQRLIQGFGHFSAKQPTPPTANTLFEIGSITKLFTGIALAQLELDGQVSLDDPITNYLPNIPIASAAQAITLRQLATHTSGLPRLPANLEQFVTDDANPYANYTAEALYQELADVKLEAAPGTQYAYSNLGMGLLGHLLTLRTGQSYATLLQQLICAPLQLIDTVISLTSDQQQRLTPGHAIDGALVPNSDFDVLAPAGALRSTPADMLRLVEASLTPSKNSLSRAIAHSQTVQFQSPQEPELSLGLAWHILKDPAGEVVYMHNGGTGGYSSFLILDQSTQTGVILLSSYGDAFSPDPDFANALDAVGFQILDATAASPHS